MISSVNPQKTADFVTFTEEILNGKLHFLCSDYYLCKSSFATKASITLFLQVTKLEFNVA